MARVPDRIPTSDEVNIELAKRALRMKRSGMNLFDIAEALQMTEMASNATIRRGLEMAQATIGFAERRELLAVEVDRLDALQHADDAERLQRIRGEVREMCGHFPVPASAMICSA